MAKMLVKRMERINISGTSKKGNPYTIDETRITVDMPITKQDAFGFKEVTYVYGTSHNFTVLEQFKDKLPLELDIELTAGFDAYDNSTTVISSVKPMSK